jgi:predicted metal-dependent hydrolase
MTKAEVRSVAMFDDVIEYELRRSHRTTLSISVLPDRRILVVAPEGASCELLDSKIRRRAAWIRRQQQFFESLPPTPMPRQWVSGETHRYLGRQYKLRVVKGTQSSVRLNGAFFVVSVANIRDSRMIESAMEDWYLAHAREQFNKRMRAILSSAWLSRSPTPQVFLRRMKLRWGSTTRAGRICLNVDLVKMPLPCIDYVIAHELVHLQIPNHGLSFKRQLSRLIPDWQTRKLRLDRQEY